MPHYFTVVLQLTGISTISNDIYCPFPWFNFWKFYGKPGHCFLFTVTRIINNVNMALGGDIANYNSSLEILIKNLHIVLHVKVYYGARTFQVLLPPSLWLMPECPCTVMHPYVHSIRCMHMVYACVCTCVCSQVHVCECMIFMTKSVIRDRRARTKSSFGLVFFKAQTRETD